MDNGRKVSAQFDHFYSKSEYPYLALSFYNLIPCCPTCNKAKGETQIVINPYAEGFEDKGRIIIDSLMNCVLHDADWTVKLDTDARCATNVSAFVLDELYQKHKDYAHEIVWKIIANERGYLESLINTFKEMGLNDDLIQRVLLGIYLDEDKMLDKPLSKMTLDILKQLKGT